MAEALFALEGAHCVSLGVQTPLGDIVAAAQGAARRHRRAVVFERDLARARRSTTSSNCSAGSAGTPRCGPAAPAPRCCGATLAPARVLDLDDIPGAVARWRAQHARACQLDRMTVTRPCSGKIRAIQFIVPGTAGHVHAAPATTYQCLVFSRKTACPRAPAPPPPQAAPPAPAPAPVCSAACAAAAAPPASAAPAAPAAPRAPLRHHLDLHRAAGHAAACPCAAPPAPAPVAAPAPEPEPRR